MALDKQRILSELGSVMNQLQSADCGCMGKLFGSPGQCPGRGAPLPTCGGCRRGCCAGHGKPMGMDNMGTGDPYAMGGGGMGRPGMGQPGMGYPGMGNMGMRNCDPPSLYANTYGYLNQNLMKPVMNEVYNDLKSISPANAVGNNPLAAQMGLSGGAGPGNSMANGNMRGQMEGGEMGNADSMVHGLPASKMMGGGQTMMNEGQQMVGGGQQMMGGGQSMMGGGQSMRGGGQSMMGNAGMTSGMGEQIMRMMSSSGGGGGGGGKHAGQGGQPTDQMTNEAPNANYSQMGMSYPGQGMGGPAGHEQLGNPGMARQEFTNPQQQTQFYSGDQGQQRNAGGKGGVPHISGNVTMPTAGMMPTAGSNMESRGSYGPHSAGMKKFSEMFPGVCKTDLGFDPMALAIQMNPANEKRAAMDSLQKVMGIKPTDKNATNPQLGQQLLPEQYGGQQLAPVQQSIPGNAVTGQLQYQGQSQQIPPGQQGYQDPNTQYQGQVVPPRQGLTPPGQVTQPMYQGQQQQVYAATGAPSMNQQQIPPLQQYQDPNTQYQAQVVPSGQGFVPDPNRPNQDQVIPSSRQGLDPSGQQQQVYAATGAPTMSHQQSTPGQQEYLEPQYHDEAESNANADHSIVTEGKAAPQQGMMYREPIFPAIRQPPTTSLPSTHKYATYYNALGQPYQLVPQSSYKTHEVNNMPQSLSWPEPDRVMAVKQTISKTSITRNTPLGNTPSRSQLRHYYRLYKGVKSNQGLKIPPVMQPSQMTSASDGKLKGQIPINNNQLEKVGGDTIDNSRIKNEESKAAKAANLTAAHGDMKNVPVKTLPNQKQRNGLQDLRFSERYMSNAWSLYGRDQPPVRHMSRGTAPILPS